MFNTCMTRRIKSHAIFVIFHMYLYYITVRVFSSTYYIWAFSYVSVFLYISVAWNEFILASLPLSTLYHYGVTKCLKCIVPHLFASHFISIQEIVMTQHFLFIIEFHWIKKVYWQCNCLVYVRMLMCMRVSSFNVIPHSSCQCIRLEYHCFGVVQCKQSNNCRSIWWP